MFNDDGSADGAAFGTAPGVAAGAPTAVPATPDMQFSLDTVNCVGCCGLAPVMTVGQDVHGKLKQSSVPRVIKKYRAKEAPHAETVH